MNLDIFQEEKVHIAERHLIPKQLKEHGLTEKHFILPTDSTKVLSKCEFFFQRNVFESSGYCDFSDEFLCAENECGCFSFSLHARGRSTNLGEEARGSLPGGGCPRGRDELQRQRGRRARESDAFWGRLWTDPDRGDSRNWNDQLEGDSASAANRSGRECSWRYPWGRFPPCNRDISNVEGMQFFFDVSKFRYYQRVSVVKLNERGTVRFVKGQVFDII